MFRKLVVCTILTFVAMTMFTNLRTGRRRLVEKSRHLEGRMPSSWKQDDVSDEFFIERGNKTVRMSLRYTTPPATHIHRVGRRFRVDTTLARHLAGTVTSFITLTERSATDHVFLTAASADHFAESRDAVASVQRHFPTKTILYYDLGLTQAQTREIKSWCRVEYRVLNFKAYPPHVGVLKKYAWKALIAQEVASSHGAFLWFDSSARFHTSDLSALYALAVANGGIGHVRTAPHSNYAVTHRKTYEFLPTDADRQKHVQQVTSGVILYYNTETMYRHVLWWMVLCALDPYCTAPIPWVPCDFKTYDRWMEYARCHRYDQSVVNVLVSNLYGFDNARYLVPVDVEFVRRPTGDFELRKC